MIKRKLSRSKKKKQTFFMYKKKKYLNIQELVTTPLILKKNFMKF